MPNAERCHAVDAGRCIEQLGSDARVGLSQSEICRRQETFGRNDLQTATPVRWWQVFARQFWDVLVVILLAAALISAAVGHVTDALTILAIVALNAVLGFVQEWKAERALDALRTMLQPSCKTIRDGRENAIDASGLVPGDLVVLSTGDRVPADLRLVETQRLRIDESALTGESLPSKKNDAAVAAETALADRSCMAWMGTMVTAGRAKGVVTAIGPQSQFGHIASMTSGVSRETTPLQRKLSRLGKQLGLVAVSVAVVFTAIGLWSGRPWMDMFLTGVSMAVAIVPEGLPAVVTLTLAIGVRAMVQKKALLRRLRAAETLGSATVICTDKTGTLTQNQMTVTDIWTPRGEVQVTGVGYEPNGHFECDGQRIDDGGRDDLLALFEAACQCNNAAVVQQDGQWLATGEPTESALIVCAMKAQMKPAKREQNRQEIPFSSERKRMSVIIKADGNRWAYVKGAPEVILQRCTTKQDDWNGASSETAAAVADKTLVDATQACERLAAKGLRTLAIARKKLDESVDPADEETIERDLELLGIVGMLDPPRPSAGEAVRTAGEAGIRTIMITGDSPVTASSIADQIGLRHDDVMTGHQVEQVSDDELRELVRSNILFARTTPEHKLRIVSSLQGNGEVVAMTGDGVNDAPALKKADIGIAMGGRGTDVARGAADIILTDDNFSSIVDATAEGRRQYDNIQKFVRYLLSSNTGELIAIFVNILVGGPLIFLPVQILWMNLVTDGATAVALGMEAGEPGLMKRPPRSPRQPIIDGRGFASIAIFGAYIGLVSFAVHHFYLSSNDPRRSMVAQTAAFTCIVLIEKANVFNFRSFSQPMHQIGWFSNPWVIVAVTVTIALQAAAVYVPPLQTMLHTVPLAPVDWVVIAAAALPIFIVSEIIKTVRHA